MKTQLFEWFQWNNAANESFIKTLKNVNGVPDKCVIVLSHIINEHEAWLNRICAVSQDIPVPQTDDQQRIAVHNALVHEITNSFLASESYGENFDWSFKYRNAEGNIVERSLKEAYFQILTYSEFHRGQVATLLKENGIDPPSTDYLSLKN